jgi:hypothetical protein
VFRNGTNYVILFPVFEAITKPNHLRKTGGGFFMNNNKGNKMTTITIDNKEYDLDQLSDEAKAQIVSIQFVDSELQRINAKASVLQTARLAYSKALNDTLGQDLVFNS